MGHASTRVVDTSTRGDLHCWLSDSDVASPSDEHTANIGRLRELVGRIKHVGRALSSTFDLRISRCSIQVARYPAGGARYAKHADSTPLHSTDRRITALLYLNDEATLSGGSLRLYRNERSLLTPALYRGEANEIDVKPVFPKLIIFPSECYHEVMPAFSSRCSLTCWFYTPLHDVAHRIERGLALRAVQPPQTQSLGSEQHTAAAAAATTELSLQDTERSEATIFVSICSYRDSELQHTVRDLFDKAAHPERLVVGICWQFDAAQDMDACFGQYDYRESHWAGQIREIRMSHRAAKGPVYARALIQRYLYRDEAFVLQIDSHMRFAQHWDDALVDMLQQCERQDRSLKCVLSAYPPGYELPDVVPRYSPPTLLCAKKDFVSLQMADPDRPGAPFTYDMIRLHARVFTGEIPDRPVRGLFYAAGFAFSRGSVVRDAPYPLDLPHCFFGEELLMLRRMYDQGYRMYAPNKTVVWHLWSRAYRPTVFGDQRAAASAPPVVDRSPTAGDQAHLRPGGKVLVVDIPAEYLTEHSPEEVARAKLASCVRVAREFGLVQQEATPQGDVALRTFQDAIGIDFASRVVSTYAQFGGQEDSGMRSRLV